MKQIQAQLGHRSPVVSLSVYATCSRMHTTRLWAVLTPTTAIKVQPRSGPNAVELPEQRPSQASDQGV